MEIGRRPLPSIVRLALVALFLLGAGWTCSAMMRPRQVASMTWEQALDLAGRGNAAAALVLTQHMREGIVAIRALGHDGRILLDQLAKEAAR